MCVFILPINLF